MTDLINRGFHIIIVGVSTMGLDKDWLGRELDKETIAKLVSISKKVTALTSPLRVVKLKHLSSTARFIGKSFKSIRLTPTGTARGEYLKYGMRH